MAGTGSDSTDIGAREKLGALVTVGRYQPNTTAAIALFSIATALLEGVGLSFIVPIVEIARGDGDPTAGASGLMEVFVTIYRGIGVPLTLETAIVGVTLVMFVRYGASFVSAWIRDNLQKQYQRELQARTIEGVLNARVAYFDRMGSDKILNAVITEPKYGSHILTQGLKLFEHVVIAAVYLAIGLYLAPELMAIFLVGLGGVTLLSRYVVESGESLGDRVAAANERLQSSVQTGAQGIRDVKLFGMTSEVLGEVLDALDQHIQTRVKMVRNQAFIRNFYEFAAAVTIFALIYTALTLTSLSLAELGVFLFAMFRFAPKMSAINDLAYTIEGNIPHLLRNRAFVDGVEREAEPSGGDQPPARIDSLAFENVTFAYEDEPVVRDVSLQIDGGEFVALVGPSGAGKSTVASLLARLYEPDGGQVTANGRPIHEFDLGAWRSQVAMVRQDPFLFDETLEFNLTIGARGASRAELDWACEIARVDEFFDELPQGYETTLGEDGVQLSGGQRQRVALARALLTDAPILILDEATSDLDSHLEADIHDAVNEAERDRTVLAIAHQLSTVSSADRIHTVEDGEIVETGTHEELLEADGTYASLYASQQT